MFCVACGQSLPDNANFCLNCGIKINQDGASAAKEKTEKDWMYQFIKEQVSKTLKSPASAVFSDPYDIDTDDYGRVYAEVAVDSQNSYGAVVRTKFGIVISDVTDIAPPKLIYGPVTISFISSPKTIKSIGKFGKPLSK